MMSRRSFSNYK